MLDFYKENMNDYEDSRPFLTSSGRLPSQTLTYTLIRVL